jgi:hypothetical protein
MAQATLTISLVYDNNQLTPISFTKVILKKNGIPVDSAFTDSLGLVNFYNLPADTFQCVPVCTKAWGGVNSTDALRIMLNFVHLNGFYLTGLRLWAGEINGLASGVPGSLDALLITRRFTGILPNFRPPNVVPGQPDWKYEYWIKIILDGPGVYMQQIKMLCTGDTNGSFIPN